MDVKEVREALERGLDKEHLKKSSDAMECMTTHRWYWRWAQDLESNCKDALAALTSIDPEAIRAEALREAVSRALAWKWPEDGTGRHDLFNRGVDAACSAILADEPKEREGGFRWHCKDCASEFKDSFTVYYCDDDAGEGAYVGACPVCGSRNLITACSQIKEAER